MDYNPRDPYSRLIGCALAGILVICLLGAATGFALLFWVVARLVLGG